MKLFYLLAMWRYFIFAWWMVFGVVLTLFVFYKLTEKEEILEAQ